MWQSVLMHYVHGVIQVFVLMLVVVFCRLYCRDFGSVPFYNIVNKMKQHRIPIMMVFCYIAKKSVTSYICAFMT